MTRPIHMTIFSQADHLPVVRAAVERVCAQLGFDEETAHEIVLGLDEALANVIRHAYGGAPDKPIDIDVMPMQHGRDRGLCIRVRDYGRASDPATFRSRDLDDVRPGGLGVHIMNSCMDRVEYQPVEGGGTMLTMIKCVPCSRPESSDV